MEGPQDNSHSKTKCKLIVSKPTLSFDNLLEVLTELMEAVILMVIAVYDSKSIQIKNESREETSGAEYKKFPGVKASSCPLPVKS